MMVSPRPMAELGRHLCQSRIKDWSRFVARLWDSKCHLGVMNPGRFKPHRACAIQCLAGGIPPILVAQTADGKLAHYLLVGPDGGAVNAAVIDYAAEPVEVSGTLKIVGGRKVLYSDLDTLKRL